MDQTYRDERDRQIVLPPYPPVQPPVPASGGFMDWIKNNKLAFLIGILILAGLIWYFFMRKPAGANINVTTNVPSGYTPTTKPATLQVHKTRVGTNANGSALY